MTPIQRAHIGIGDTAAVLCQSRHAAAESSATEAAIHKRQMNSATSVADASWRRWPVSFRRQGQKRKLNLFALRRQL
jgi:hypothetical protein